ncbi:hypothetical protein GPECTOR_3g381 [Gonium pectorale]|uniref:Uncharacterized protein n=1 Tax=Gonium pectorale TaxID=33097 RepID=A0A150GZH1_GONPE|nr:hypothetical protein GPECTOR_3g381 [Gonium pectorale]|eukprot:KXZ55241.1 hypothetical protein GPECTOR_3g381 [Gonium pectorale]
MQGRAGAAVEEGVSLPTPTRNPVFNPTRWSYHRSTSRYGRHLTTIFKSVTFRNLQAPLSFLTMMACLVVLYRTSVELEQLPDFFEGVTFTDVPFQLTSFALSLLLVFRTDAGYGRWCAAMDAWGTLRNASADLIRKASAWVDDGPHLRRLVRWVAAFPLCLMVELRHDQGDPAMEGALRAELARVLRPYELQQVLAAGPYHHQFCLSVLTALVEAAQLGESRETAMLEDLHGFNDAACECEKILRFPIPLTYTRHTSRFMLIYLSALPLALYDSCDWAVIPVTAVIAFLLLGIEDIGVQIEEPFSILPLPDICADLHMTAQRAVAQRDMVRCLADPAVCRVRDEDLEPTARRHAAAHGGPGTSYGEGRGHAATGHPGAGPDAWQGDEYVVEAGFGSGGVAGGGGVGAGAGAGASARSNGNGAGGGAGGGGGKGVGARGRFVESGKGPGLVAAISENGNGNGYNGNGNGYSGGTASGWPHRP